MKAVFVQKCDECSRYINIGDRIKKWGVLWLHNRCYTLMKDRHRGQPILDIETTYKI